MQDCLQGAISRVASHAVALQCAGRTDAGVHATAQVAHFDTTSARSERQWLLGINSHLPKDINVSWIKPVSDDFHARFAAGERRYRYLVLNRSHRSALLHHRVHLETRPLDAPCMHEAAQHLLGTHDFSAFRASACQAKTAVRTVRSLTIARQGEFVTLDIAADAFLQNMVRIVTGSLLRIGRGEADAQWLSEVLEAGDRRHLGATAPADGLYLTAVVYPREHQLPSVPAVDPLLPFIRAG